MTPREIAERLVNKTVWRGGSESGRYERRAPLADEIERAITEALAAQREADAKRHELDLIDVADFFGIDGPYRYDGAWRAQIRGTNTAIARFQDRAECEAYIAKWREKLGEPEYQLIRTGAPSDG